LSTILTSSSPTKDRRQSSLLQITAKLADYCRVLQNSHLCIWDASEPGDVVRHVWASEPRGREADTISFVSIARKTNPQMGDLHFQIEASMAWRGRSGFARRSHRQGRRGLWPER
jgi:hypothetical protein